MKKRKIILVFILFFSILIISFVFAFPTIILNSPEDNHNTTSSIILFNGTVFDAINVTNVTLYGNWNGNWHANETNSSGINNTDYLFSKILSDGIYSWNYYACDNSSNCDFVYLNRTLTIDTTAPYFTAIENQTVPVNVAFFYDVNALDIYTGIGEFRLNDSSVFSINSSTGVIINITELSSEIFYMLNISINDTLGNLNWSLWYVNIILDLEKPSVLVNSPNETTYTNSKIVFNLTANDNLKINSCWYSLDEEASENFTLSNSAGNFYTDSESLSDGDYIVLFWCSDTSGNLNNTSSIEFTVNASDDEEVLEELDEGFSFNKNETRYTLRANQEVQINLSNEKQALIRVESVNASLNLTIISVEGVNHSLEINKSLKIDLDNDSYYDVEISVIQFYVTGFVRLVFKQINEEIPVKEEEPVEELALVEEEEVISDKKNPFLIFYIIGGVIGIGLIIFAIFKLSKYLDYRKPNK